jgi:hypothetical protein
MLCRSRRKDKHQLAVCCCWIVHLSQPQPPLLVPISLVQKQKVRLCCCSPSWLTTKPRPQRTATIVARQYRWAKIAFSNHHYYCWWAAANRSRVKHVMRICASTANSKRPLLMGETLAAAQILQGLFWKKPFMHWFWSVFTKINSTSGATFVFCAWG